MPPIFKSYPDNYQDKASTITNRSKLGGSHDPPYGRAYQDLDIQQSLATSESLSDPVNSEVKPEHIRSTSATEKHHPRFSGVMKNAQEVSRSRAEMDNMRSFPSYCFTSKYVVHPNSRFLVQWHTLVCFVTVIIALWQPVRLAFVPRHAFDRSLPIRCFEACIDICLLIDVLLRLNTGFWDKQIESKTMLNQNRSSIVSRYARGQLTVDMLSSIPFGLLCWFCSLDLRETSMLRLLRLLRMGAVVRKSYMPSWVKAMEQHLGLTHTITRLIQTLLGIVYSAHFVGCLWYTVWDQEGRPDEGWIKSYDSEFEPTQLLVAYNYALYWSFTTLTTVGYGDICPQTNIERLFTMAVFLVGVCGFGYLTGNIGDLVTELTRSENQYQQKLADIDDWLTYRGVSNHLRSKVHSYFAYYWKMTPLYDEADIMNRMTPHLEKQVVLHLSNQVLLNNKYFAGHGDHFTMSIIRILKPEHKGSGEYLTVTGEVATSMFFVTTGSIDVVKNSKTVAVLNAPVSFGEGGLFGAFRNATTIARDQCDLYALDSDELRQLLADNQTEGKQIFKAMMLEYWQRNQNQRRQLLRNVEVESGEGSDSTVRAATLIQYRWLNRSRRANQDFDAAFLRLIVEPCRKKSPGHDQSTAYPYSQQDSSPSEQGAMSGNFQALEQRLEQQMERRHLMLQHQITALAQSHQDTKDHLERCLASLASSMQVEFTPPKPSPSYRASNSYIFSADNNETSPENRSLSGRWSKKRNSSSRQSFAR